VVEGRQGDWCSLALRALLIIGGGDREIPLALVRAARSPFGHCWFSEAYFLGVCAWCPLALRALLIYSNPNVVGLGGAELVGGYGDFFFF
jgi:hypothetical protein